MAKNDGYSDIAALNIADSPVPGSYPPRTPAFCLNALARASSLLPAFTTTLIFTGLQFAPRIEHIMHEKSLD